MQMSIHKKTCARIPTNAGEFQLCLYRSNYDDKEHLVLISGDVVGQPNVLVRVHSECFTGDTLGSLRCDCGPQLNQAMRLIAAQGQGIIVYLRQEGRGIGLLDKLRAYNLQDMGYDTVDANLMLGHQADARDYTIASLILNDIGVDSIRLLTNNPLKVESLQRHGLEITERIPLQTPITKENVAYLTTKVERMRHLLNLEQYSQRPHLNGHAAPAIDRQMKTPSGNGRPYVTLSYAQSLDGSITAQPGKPMTISGPSSMTMTHQLRARHDAILVGINTVLADDPSLSVRLVNGNNPQPVVLDSRLRFPLAAKLLQNQANPPWIATTTAAVSSRQEQLEAAGGHILRLPATPDGRVSLSALLTKLAAMGITSLMVEGGASIITNFLAAHLVDRLVVTVAPMLVGGLNAVGGLRHLNGHDFPQLSNIQYQRLGDDLVISGDVAWKART